MARSIGDVCMRLDGLLTAKGVGPRSGVETLSVGAVDGESDGEDLASNSTLVGSNGATTLPFGFLRTSAIIRLL